MFHVERPLDAIAAMGPGPVWSMAKLRSTRSPTAHW